MIRRDNDHPVFKFYQNYEVLYIEEKGDATYA